MCQFLSGVITKDRTLYNLDNDSHEELIKKAGLNDKTDSPNFVRVELIPKDQDIFNHDPKNWELKIDQDFRPEWFSDKFAEQEMRKVLSEVIRERFIIDDKSWQKRTGQRIFIKNSSVEAWENSSVEARENSSVVARGNSSVEAWGNSSVEAWENSSVVARENSSVVARENSSVVARGNSQILLPYDYPVKIKGVYDNATVKDIPHGKIIVAKKFKQEVFKKK